jgi:hypothetical protein
MLLFTQHHRMVFVLRWITMVRPASPWSSCDEVTCCPQAGSKAHTACLPA